MNALVAGTDDVVEIVAGAAVSAGAKPCATLFPCRTLNNDGVMMKVMTDLNDVDARMAFRSARFVSLSRESMERRGVRVMGDECAR